MALASQAAASADVLLRLATWRKAAGVSDSGRLPEVMQKLERDLILAPFGLERLPEYWALRVRLIHERVRVWRLMLECIEQIPVGMGEINGAMANVLDGAVESMPGFLRPEEATLLRNDFAVVRKLFAEFEAHFGAHRTGEELARALEASEQEIPQPYSDFRLLLYLSNALTIWAVELATGRQPRSPDIQAAIVADFDAAVRFQDLLSRVQSLTPTEDAFGGTVYRSLIQLWTSPPVTIAEVRRDLPPMAAVRHAELVAKGLLRPGAPGEFPGTSVLARPLPPGSVDEALREDRSS